MSGLVDRGFPTCPSCGADVTEGVLRFVATTDELRQIGRALEAEGVTGNAMLTWRDGSPWIEVAVATTVVLPTDPPAMPYFDVARLALWRATGAVHRVGPDGAVEEDPLPGFEGCYKVPPKSS